MPEVDYANHVDKAIVGRRAPLRPTVELSGERLDGLTDKIGFCPAGYLGESL